MDAKWWVKDFLKQNREKIENRLGVQIKKLLGGGSFGCVYKTDKPGVAIKITHDPYEGWIANKIHELQKKINLPGFVNYHKVERWVSKVEIYGRKWTVWIFLRDEVDIARPDWVESEGFDDTLLEYVYSACRLQFATPTAQKEILKETELKLFEIQTKYPDAKHVVESLSLLAQHSGVYITDIHSDNLTMVNQNGKERLLMYDLGYSQILDVFHEEIKEIERVGWFGLAKAIGTAIPELVKRKIIKSSARFYSNYIHFVYPLPDDSDLPSYPLSSQSIKVFEYLSDVLAGLWEYISDENAIDLMGEVLTPIAGIIEYNTRNDNQLNKVNTDISVGWSKKFGIMVRLKEAAAALTTLARQKPELVLPDYLQKGQDPLPNFSKIVSDIFNKVVESH